MKKVIFSCIIMAILIMVNQSWADEVQVTESAGQEAADVKYDLGNVIVSATKTETYQAEIGSSTTVITA
ncbi:MAG: hypothetical protein PHO40_06960, partial [Candidatus Omnitrophica bacterium]|nr:hypothetical protein [Candidatus Omnitrophota bacterium]